MLEDTGVIVMMHFRLSDDETFIMKKHSPMVDHDILFNLISPSIRRLLNQSMMLIT